ncbi:MAG: carboxypeptidase regulatory-like domain-containing protein [Planctomycetes bacterium]|nr:carboxypeptidase regulatory-like domain-containing protein [Planctomycetota bacterium]
MNSLQAHRSQLLALLVLVAVVGLAWLALRTPSTPVDVLEIEAAVAAAVVAEDAPVLTAPEHEVSAARATATEPIAPATSPIASASAQATRSGTGSIAGRVRVVGRHADEPVSAAVEFERLTPSSSGRQSSGTRLTERPDSVSVNADGTFATGAIALGRWRVTCKAPRAVSAVREVELTEAGQSVRCDFDLEPTQSFRLSLFDTKGRNLAQAVDRATASRIDALRIVVSATELPRAGERFDGRGLLSFKSRHVAAEADGAWAQIDTQSDTAVWCGVVLDQVVQAAQFVPFGQRSVSLTLSVADLHAAQCSLELRVESEGDARLIAGARLTLTWPAADTVKGVSDASGRFVARDLLPADIDVRVEAAGYAASELRITLAPDIDNSLTVQLKRSVSISGVLRDSAGQPRRGNVWIRFTDGKRKEAADVRVIEVGPDGAFRIEDLAPDTYFVSALNFSDIGFGTDMNQVIQRVDCTGGPVAGIALVRP